MHQGLMKKVQAVLAGDGSGNRANATRRKQIRLVFKRNPSGRQGRKLTWAAMSTAIWSEVSMSFTKRNCTGSPLCLWRESGDCLSHCSLLTGRASLPLPISALWSRPDLFPPIRSKWVIPKLNPSTSSKVSLGASWDMERSSSWGPAAPGTRLSLSGTRWSFEGSFSNSGLKFPALQDGSALWIMLRVRFYSGFCWFFGFRHDRKPEM